MSKIIKLNVGGVIFQTTKATLSKSGMMNAMISGEFEESQKDEIFIDRNPDIFKYILEILRGYPIDEELRKSHKIKNILCDLDYFAIDVNWKRIPSQDRSEITQALFSKEDNIIKSREKLTCKYVCGKIVKKSGGVGLNVKVVDPYFIQWFNDITKNLCDKFSFSVKDVHEPELDIIGTSVVYHYHDYIMERKKYKDDTRIEEDDDINIDVIFDRAICFWSKYILCFRIGTIYVDDSA